MVQGSTSTNRWTAENLFKVYKSWRSGLLKILTSNNGRLPWETLPSVLQQGSLGISFANNEALRKDWLSLASHDIDAWLVHFCYFYSSYLNQHQNKLLSNWINELPKVYDIVTRQEPMNENTTVDITRRNIVIPAESKEPSVEIQENLEGHQFPSPTEEERPLQQEEEEQGDCGICGRCKTGFFMHCDTCGKPFYGKCVHYTPAEADHIPSYKCESCDNTFCSICKEDYTDDKVWIKCYYCDKDFHLNCVQITPAQMERYRCRWCINLRPLG